MSDETGFTLTLMAVVWAVVGVLAWGTPQSVTAFAACSIIGAIGATRGGPDQ